MTRRIQHTRLFNRNGCNAEHARDQVVALCIQRHGRADHERPEQVAGAADGLQGDFTVGSLDFSARPLGAPQCRGHRFGKLIEQFGRRCTFGLQTHPSPQPVVQHHPAVELHLEFTQRRRQPVRLQCCPRDRSLRAN